MKKLAVIAIAALVVAAFAGCANDENAQEISVSVSMTGDIETVGSATRTANPAAPVWTSGDAIGVHFVGDAPMNHFRLNSELSNGGQTATFSGNVSLRQGAYTIYGYYPYGSAGAQTTDQNLAKISIPSTQRPTATSFDPAADVMIMKPVERAVSGTNFTHNGLQFRRVLGMLNFVLTAPGLEGQAIESLTFTTDAGLQLTGMAHYDLDEGTFAEFYEGASTSVTATPNGTVTANGTDGIMVCVPVMTIPTGAKMTVTGQTKNFTFEKTRIVEKAIVLEAGNWHNMNVTLEAGDIAVRPIPVASVAMNRLSAAITMGETLQLSATVLPTDATNKELNWVSSNTQVASVDATGLVTSLGEGNTIITATATDGSEKSATCSVTVNAADARIEFTYLGTPLSYATTATLGLFTVTLQTFEGTSRPQGTSSYKLGLKFYAELSDTKELTPGEYIFTRNANNASGVKWTVYKSTMARYDEGGNNLGNADPTVDGTSKVTVTKDGNNYTFIIDMSFPSSGAPVLKGVYTGPIAF